MFNFQLKWLMNEYDTWWKILTKLNGYFNKNWKTITKKLCKNEH